MKNKIRILGFIAIAAVIGFSLTACPQTPPSAFVPGVARFLSADNQGNVLELIVTQSESNARYAGQKDDSYNLNIWNAGTIDKTSTGSVASVSGSTLGLRQRDASDTFSVTVQDSWIKGITGSIPIDGGTTLSQPTLANANTIALATDVLYGSAFGSDNAAARTITDFSYIFEQGGPMNIASLMPGTSVTINNGKVTVTLGTPTNQMIEELTAQMVTGATLTVSGGGDKVNISRQDKPLIDENGEYLILPVKTATATLLEYAYFIYAEKAFTLRGTSENGKETWDCDAKQGWNYFLVKEVAVNGELQNTYYSTPADSSRVPDGYRWTVFSQAAGMNLRPWDNGNN